MVSLIFITGCRSIEIPPPPPDVTDCCDSISNANDAIAPYIDSKPINYDTDRSFIKYQLIPLICDILASNKNFNALKHSIYRFEYEVDSVGQINNLLMIDQKNKKTYIIKERIEGVFYVSAYNNERKLISNKTFYLKNFNAKKCSYTFY